MKLTPRALELYDALSPALHTINRALETTPFLAEEVDRVFNVSMTSTDEQLAMPIFISKLQQIAPDAQVKVHPEYLRDIPNRLKDGRLDYSIDFVRLPEDEFSSRCLTTETLETICAPNHPLAGKTILEHELDDLKHISVMPRSSHMDVQGNQLFDTLGTPFRRGAAKSKHRLSRIGVLCCARYRSTVRFDCYRSQKACGAKDSVRQLGYFEFAVRKPLARA